MQHIINKKGIISNVTLDGKVLTGWTSYLTSKWIPNFQMNTTTHINTKAAGLRDGLIDSRQQSKSSNVKPLK